MPRNLQARFGIFVGALLSGCWFNADYGTVACSDGVCPSGLVCANAVCVAKSIDAPMTKLDAPAHDAQIDAPTQIAALTCADPGTCIAADTVTGTTTGRLNTISASCNAAVMFGADAIYKIAGTIGQQLTLTPHSSAYPITAYAISPCTMVGTPACVGNTYATDTTPITIAIPATTDYFIVVDGGNAALSGAYSLTIALH
jgi:hypothetical protein